MDSGVGSCYVDVDSCKCICSILATHMQKERLDNLKAYL